MHKIQKYKTTSKIKTTNENQTTQTGQKQTKHNISHFTIIKCPEKRLGFAPDPEWGAHMAPITLSI